MIDPKNVSPIKHGKEKDIGGDEKTRPTTPPKSDRDFNKLLEERKESKYSDEIEPDSDLDVAEFEEEVQKKSLFDTPKPKEKQTSQTSFSDTPMRSIYKDTSIASRTPEIKTRETRREDRKPVEKEKVKETEGVESEETETEVLEKVEKVEKTEKGQFEVKGTKIEEKKDIPKARTDAQVEGVAATNPQPGMVTQPQAEVAPRAKVAEVVQALVSEIVNVYTNGQVDTVVVLRNPPLLDGATIKLTSYATAPNEFNITFANLTPQAKTFLDQKLLQNSLTEQLQSNATKIVVHQIITTTQPDAALPTGDSRTREGGHEGGGGGAGGGGEGGRGREGGGEQRRQR